ncbi:MAG TPA: ABC transporter permease [Prolixibacteraceae bacterium]|nr:ABC transporter permease [Prolixibacteraceae bacterium]
MKISITGKQFWGFAAVVFLLAVWKIVSLLVGSGFVLPSPEKTLLTTMGLFGEKEFLSVVSSTLMRGLAGFALSVIPGIGLGVLAGLHPNFNAFLQPILITIRSVPVIALILLALIWFSPGLVPVFIALLTMFPFICINVIDGMKSIDRELTEMASFYRVGRYRMIRELYIPGIMPFIISGASSAMGIGWRAIITGEVLSQPRYGIGTLMHEAQTFLNVDAVIAWTILAVALGFGFEKIIRWSERKLFSWRY